MSAIINLFNLILYQPLFNAVVLLYDYVPGHDFGVTIIVLTVLIRFLLYPLMAQSIKSQKVLSELQPKLQEIQKRYADDKQKQAQATMELYKKEKFNPFGGCLPLLVQLPILIALYRVFLGGFGPDRFSFLYSFVPHPGAINPMFLGLVDLSVPNIVLALLAGAGQYFQSKMLSPKQKKLQQKDGQMNQVANMVQKQMIYLFPLFTVFILWRLPSAIGIYWITTTVFSIIQQYIIYRPRKSSVPQAVN
jgi:YidC/Oxa1 family membrane protein insertase